MFTNLRVIWFSDSDQTINLSIGLDCIIDRLIKEATSILKGNATSLFIKSKFNSNRYEFIFTSLVHQSPRLFSSFDAVLRSYQTSKMYRELKLRSAIIEDKNLILLNKETIFSKISKVQNLSQDQNCDGIFILTNIRIVWFSNNSPEFNIAVPWVQVKTIRIRESKYGQVLVIETSKYSGSYTLGFKMDELESRFLEIDKYLKCYSENPIFGVETSFETPKILSEVYSNRLLYPE